MSNNHSTNLLRKAEFLFDSSENGQVIPLLHKLLQHANLDPVVKKKALNLLGLVYYKQGNLAKAEEYLKESLEVAKLTGDVRLVYNSYDNLAAVYISANKTHPAMDCLQKALFLKEESNKSEDLARGYIQLASLQLSIGNIEAGKDALTRSLELIKKHKQYTFLMHWYFAESSYYAARNLHSKAIASLSKAINYAVEHNEPYIQSRCYHNMGNVYMLLNNVKQAEKNFLSALGVTRKHNMKLDELNLLNELAHIALLRKDYAKCEQLLHQVRAEANQYGNDQLFRMLEEVTAELEEAKGNHEAALHHYREFMKVYKRFYDNELSRLVVDMQAKYESEKKERELKEAKLREVESELKALRSQMNPHFIFNAIGSIRHTLLEGKADEADKLMLRFSRLLRLILDSSRKPSMPLNENIELLHLYIQTEQARYSQPFDYSITVDKKLNLAAIQVPGMILQPVVENAIIHGLFHKTSGRGKLSISFSKEKTALKVEVTDNGIGREKAKSYAKKEHTSHATSIIKETLRLAWKTDDVSRYFVIKDNRTGTGKPNGTTVTVRIPLQ
ncbi:MAG: tetratricopeptide repeat protein [Chitinophagales bacterium]|nr:tetratricopeptide repeat protein [Chitinophagales bacterium]